MKTTLALIALALAFPAAAQSAPDQKPKMECCCRDKDKPMACCPEHGKPGKDEHEGHEMAQPQS